MVSDSDRPLGEIELNDAKIPSVNSPAFIELPQPSINHQIPSLDGLRAIAIILVLIGQIGLTLAQPNGALHLLLPIFGNTELGTTLFFVLSGFLITTLLQHEIERTESIKLGSFYLRRAWRLFPAFYCYLGIIPLLRLAGKLHLSWLTFGAVALFLPTYIGLFRHIQSNDDWIVSQTWVIDIEVQFCLLWPLCLLLLKQRRAIRLAATLIVLAPVLRIVQYFIFPATRGAIPVMLHTRIDSLMVGCLIALLYDKILFKRLLISMYEWQIPTLAAIFVFAVSPYVAARFHGLYLLPLGWALNNIGVAVILLWAIDFSNSKIGILLNSRPLVHIGLISYGLYLWSQFFISKFNPLGLDKFPLNIILAIIAAELSYFALERPLLLWRERLIPAPLVTSAESEPLPT